MSDIKFKAMINHHNNNKGLGIVRATDKMSAFRSLEDYMYQLCFEAAMFANDSGMTPEEIQQAITKAGNALLKVKFIEDK